MDGLMAHACDDLQASIFARNAVREDDAAIVRFVSVIPLPLGRKRRSRVGDKSLIDISRQMRRRSGRVGRPAIL